MAIVGSSGSGKSTFAEELGAVLDTPVFHFDALYWKPGWVPASEAEQAAIEHELKTREGWIFDGIPKAMLNKRFAAADTIIFFDLPTVLCLVRGIRRRLVLPRKPPNFWPPGSKPHFDLQSLRWIWNYRRDDRPVVVAAIERHRDAIEIVHFRRRSDPRAFLAALKSSPS